MLMMMVTGIRLIEENIPVLLRERVYLGCDNFSSVDLLDINFLRL